MSRAGEQSALFVGADTVALGVADTSTFGVGDWASVFSAATNTAAYDGAAVTLRGFVTPGESGDGVNLTRLVITHCVIDAQTAALPVDVKADEYATGQWVEITGTGASGCRRQAAHRTDRCRRDRRAGRPVRVLTTSAQRCPPSRAPVRRCVQREKPPRRRRPSGSTARSHPPTTSPLRRPGHTARRAACCTGPPPVQRMLLFVRAAAREAAAREAAVREAGDREVAEQEAAARKMAAFEAAAREDAEATALPARPARDGAGFVGAAPISADPISAAEAEAAEEFPAPPAPRAPVGRDAPHAPVSRRRFALTLVAVLGVLVVVGTGLGIASLLQGPRISDVQVNAAQAIESSGSRVILTANQGPRRHRPAQVTVEPAVPFTVDASGRGVGVRFTVPLDDSTEYTIRVADAVGAGAGRRRR